MQDFVKIAEQVLVSCLGVKKDESVLVITDDTRKEIGEALYQAACDLGCEGLLMVMKEREVSGQEPPKAVAEAMKAADVVIAPTAKSLTHTAARIQAAAAGTRVATMPGITREMFGKGAMTADYQEVEKLTARITDMLTQADKARIEKDGKVLEISLKGRDGVPSPGVYKEPGKCGNLPSGEAYIAPLEDGSEGEMIIDGSMVGIGKLESPLHMKISGGKLREVTGDKSENLGILLKNETNGTLCELGIGTNEAAILNGIILEDEKVEKIGLSLKDDFGALRRRGDFVPGNFIELQDYVHQFGIKDQSLQKIYANLFGQKISKSQRLSNWEADVLSDGQKVYAAIDAWACLKIYNLLEELQDSGDYHLECTTIENIEVVPHE